MKKWYGEDFCKKTKDMNYVIDHMDNNSTNCCINNLYFLLDRYNKAKGMTLDLSLIHICGSKHLPV